MIRRVPGFKGSSEMMKFEFNSKFRFWRFRIGHSELRTIHSEPLFQSKGFTLIEIIVLIVMAGILIPAIVVPFATGIKGSVKPEMVTTAMYLGHQKMEEFMKYQYLNSALDPTAMISYADIPGFSGYQWQWQIYYVEDSSFNVVGDGIQATNHRGYKRIFVRVKDPMNDTYEIYSVVTFFP
jgi:type II secretory pathway pseudopilin PulG